MRPDASALSIHLTRHILQLQCRQLDKTTADVGDAVKSSSQHNEQIKMDAVDAGDAFDRLGGGPSSYSACASPQALDDMATYVDDVESLTSDFYVGFSFYVDCRVVGLGLSFR